MTDFLHLTKDEVRKKALEFVFGYTAQIANAVSNAKIDSPNARFIYTSASLGTAHFSIMTTIDTKVMTASVGFDTISSTEYTFENGFVGHVADILADEVIRGANFVARTAHMRVVFDDNASTYLT